MKCNLIVCEIVQALGNEDNKRIIQFRKSTEEKVEVGGRKIKFICDSCNGFVVVAWYSLHVWRQYVQARQHD